MTAATPVQVAGFETKTVIVDGRTVEYLQAGVGQPLVLLHGTPGLAANMSPAVLTLAETYRVIAPNLPGLGGGPADGISSFRDMAAFSFAFISALELDTVAVLGTSVGGYAGLWLAVDHPEAVTRLILEAPAAFRSGPPPTGPPTGHEPAQQSAERPGGQAAERPAGPPAGAGPDPDRMAFIKSIVGPDTDDALVAAMPSCEVMTLVLLGQLDRMFPPTFASFYSTLPASTVAIVYAAGHDIKGERPEAFLSVVSDYLIRGQAFVVKTESSLIHA